MAIRNRRTGGARKRPSLPSCPVHRLALECAPLVRALLALDCASENEPHNAKEMRLALADLIDRAATDASFTLASDAAGAAFQLYIARVDLGEASDDASPEGRHLKRRAARCLDSALCFMREHGTTLPPVIERFYGGGAYHAALIAGAIAFANATRADPPRGPRGYV